MHSEEQIFLLHCTVPVDRRYRFFVKHKYFDAKSGIDIREVMAIEVEHIYFAEGKTFVEVNVIHKTAGPIVFGDTADLKNKTRLFRSMTGYALIDNHHDWYFPQFPYWNTVCSVEGEGQRK